jgi:hypothetical protein
VNRALRIALWIFSGIVGIGLLGYAYFAIVVAPKLQPGEGITLFTWSSSPPTPQPKLMPKVKGDLLLVGEVRNSGHAVPNARLFFLFQDMFRSDEINADAAGRFEFRLPPGEWKFHGPVIIDSKEDRVSYIFNPPINVASPTFNVGAGPDTRTIYIKIIDGSVGPHDL